MNRRKNQMFLFFSRGKSKGMPGNLKENWPGMVELALRCFHKVQCEIKISRTFFHYFPRFFQKM